MTGTARLAALISLLGALIGCTGRTTGAAPQLTASAHAPRSPTTEARPLSDALVHRRLVLGYSVDRRPITAIERGDPDSSRRALIVGCIHGNEPAGIAIARVLATTAVPPEVDLWVVPDLNPDGVAADTRVNADGVDLNRNFPYRWARLGAPGSIHYAGPRPLSEPESRILAKLLRSVRPTLGIWYHQALTVVDSSQGPLVAERRYAAATGLPLRRLPDYPGSAVGFEDHLFGPTAFVVELPGGMLTRTQVLRHTSTVLTIAKRSRP
jgi:murein peptide amidase A